MLAVMSGDGSMSCLGLDGLAIRADQYTGHHPERSKAYKQQQKIQMYMYTVKHALYNEVPGMSNFTSL